MGEWIMLHPIPRENVPYALEVEIEGGRVINARCGAAALWGLEAVLAGKEPFDALQVVQRTHALAGVSHAIAAAVGLETLLGIVPPANGRLLRNVLQGLEFIYAHVFHFYQGVLPDFINIKGLAVPAEKLPPVTGKALREHYWQSFEVLAGIHQTMSIFGGKMPYMLSVVPGGVAVRPDYQKIFEMASRWKFVESFVRDVYVPDIETLYAAYREYGGIGAGARRLLAMGAFPLQGEQAERQQMLFPAGVLPAATAIAPEMKNLTQDMSYAWFAGGAGAPGALPAVEIKNGAYSWLPALNYKGQRYETGPLARMIVAGEEKTVRMGEAAFSVMGRHLARGYECLWLADKMKTWIDGLQSGKPAVAGKFKVPQEGSGWSVTESPAGAVAHRFHIKAGRIEFYRVLGAAAWNLAPRDGGDNKGPLEEALTGTPVVNPAQPAEVLRVFRAFT